MSRTMIGKIGMILKGEWDSNIYYKRLDVVTLDGSSYVCIKENENKNVLEKDYWLLIAKKGKDGTNGSDGIQGDKGEPFKYEDFTEEQLEGLKGEKGEKGTDGYTPQAGIDYYTEAEKLDFAEEIKTELIDDVNSEININYQQKTEAFNQNASDKTTEFNTNSDLKENEFNMNALQKTNEFNQNAESYNKKIEDLQQQNEELIKNMIFNNVEGESIDIDDAYEYGKNQLKIFGNCKQEADTEEIKCVTGNVNIKKINNISNFTTEASGKTNGTNYCGLRFEILNKYSSKISGRPGQTEYRVGGNYNSTNIVVHLDNTKKYKIRNSLNLRMSITIVKSKSNTYRQVSISNDSVLTLENGEDGISSIRFSVDTNTTYDNTILEYYIYDKEETQTIHLNDLKLYGDENVRDEFVKKVDGWYLIHNWNAEENSSIEKITDTELIADLEKLSETKTFEGVNHIFSDNEVSPIFKLEYMQSNKILNQRKDEKIKNIESRLALLEV